MKKQKFKVGTFVHVAKDLGSMMSHFENNVDAIIGYTYAQKYGGTDNKSYSLYLIKNGKVYNSVAWYEEHQLTALPAQDYDEACKMVGDFCLRFMLD